MQIQPSVPTKRKALGQGMMEYIIIVAMIAIAAIGVYGMFGKTIRNQTAGLAKELSGKDGKDDISASVTSAGEATKRGNVNKGMGKYNGDNDHN